MSSKKKKDKPAAPVTGALADMIEQVKDRLRRISTLRLEKIELEAFIKEGAGEILRKIGTLRKERERIDSEIALLENSIREAEPAAYEQLDLVVATITKVSEQAKALCHSLPASELTAGCKIVDSGMVVSISKASTHKEFKVEDLLKAHPHLAALEVEGDSLFYQDIRPGVLERLIEMGTVDQKDIDPFTVVIKDRAPSVSINDTE